MFWFGVSVAAPDRFPSGGLPRKEEEDDEEEKENREEELEGEDRRRSSMPRRRCFMPRSVHSCLGRRAHLCLCGRRPFMPTWYMEGSYSCTHDIKRRSIMPRSRSFMPTWSKGSSTHAAGSDCLAVSQMSTSSEVSSVPPAPPPSAQVTEKERDEPFWSTRGTRTLLMPSPALAYGASAEGTIPSP